MDRQTGNGFYMRLFMHLLNILIDFQFDIPSERQVPG